MKMVTFFSEFVRVRNSFRISYNIESTGFIEQYQKKKTVFKSQLYKFAQKQF